MDQAILEVVFVPLPGMGHLVSAVEVAKLLLRHDHRLSITFIILKFPFDSKIAAYTDSLLAAQTGINFIDVPVLEPGETALPNPKDLLSRVHEKKYLVKAAVDQIVGKSGSGQDSPRLAGFVIDMFFTGMIDVANEFGVPAYIYYTSPAAFLAFQLYSVELLIDEQGNVNATSPFKDSDNDLIDLPMFRRRCPPKVLPTFALFPENDKEFIKLTGRFREAKGIIVNSFQELEPYAIRALSSSDGKVPPVYPVGPILNIGGQDWKNGNEDVLTWLEDQPPLSVVFLCFGSMGSFDEEQVREIAIALERTRYRFLWCLRRPPPKGEVAPPKEYENFEEVLPEGFLTRTAGTGKVIGWAPQAAVLGHPAVGGFVSHCGWNSILESLWFGVPLATWPIYAEQQMNAFEMVVELGLGVEVRMDYRQEWATGDQAANMVVSAAEIEKAVESLMEEGSEVRKRVKEMRVESRKALSHGGSSHSNLVHFLRDVTANVKLT